MLITQCPGTRQPDLSVRTLVVDDSKFILTQLRSLLDYCVRLTVVATAENGQQALDMVRLHQPELVLMDLQMPGMNGFEAAARIKEEFPATRVVHITTHSGADVESESRRSGAQFLLPKAQFVSGFCWVFQQLFHLCEPAAVPDVNLCDVNASE